MDSDRVFKTALSGLLALTLVLGTIPAVSADRVSDAKDKLEALQAENDALGDEISDLRSQLSDNLSQIEDIAAQKNLIDQEIFLLYTQITNINDQIVSYGTLIADKQDELDAAQIHLAQMQEQNKERIRAMEKNGRISYWSVLFKASSFVDLLDRLKMIEEIADADRLRLEQTRQAAEAVEAAKAALETEKASLQNTKDSLRTTQNDLEMKRLEADGLLASLVAKGQAYEIMIDESEAKQEDLANKLAEAEDEYEDAKYWQAQQNKPKPKPPASNPGGSTESNSGGSTESNSGGSTPAVPDGSTDSNTSGDTGSTTEDGTTDNGADGTIDNSTEVDPSGSNGGSTDENTAADIGNTVDGITWMIPVSYTYFSSPFGERWHPISGQWKMHYGVDLAAPEGTPIYATRSGYVSETGYEAGGAGYYVQLNHGDGYRSVYMHLTHYIVETGQYVEAGQIIGYCGSTGGSTGPHLHFGISYEGTYVNPADYINI